MRKITLNCNRNPIKGCI